MANEPSERDYHLGMATLGHQLDDFWRSDVGQYLLTRATADYNSALFDFKACNPTNTAAVTAIQSRMLRASEFRGWMEEGIAEGLRSKAALDGLDDEQPE